MHVHHARGGHKFGPRTIKLQAGVETELLCLHLAPYQSLVPGDVAVGLPCVHGIGADLLLDTQQLVVLG